MEKEDLEVVQHTTDMQKSDGSIKTMDDLIEEMQLDLDMWEIDKAVVNKRDVQVAGGGARSLFQIKLFIRRRLSLVLVSARGLPVGPRVIGPSARFREPGVESALFIPDCQMGYRWNEDNTYLDPFHDRRAIDVALKYATDMQPNHIIILGDFLDLPTFSKFNHGYQEYVNTTQAAIEEGYTILRDLRERCFDSRIVFLLGNHDIRLRNFLSKTHGELNVLRPAQSKDSPLKIRNLLRLDELRIECNDDYDVPMYLWDKILIRHGEDYANLNASRLAMTTVQGHSHDRVFSVKTVPTPFGQRVISMVSPGCLCKTDGTVPGKSKNPDWHQGLATAYFDTRFPDGQEHMCVLPIHNGSLWDAGKLYLADDDRALAHQASLDTGIRALAMPA